MKCPKFIPNYNLYDNYYSQRGGSLPYFQGSLIQEGYGGLGSLIGRLLAKSIIPLAKSVGKIGMKHAVPMLKKGATVLGKEAFKTGTEALSDIVSKKRSSMDAIKHGATKLRKSIPDIVKSEILSTNKRTRIPAQKRNKRKKTRNFHLINSADIFSK